MGKNDLFHLPIRVYYEDTDAGGIVYHASYLRFFERARVESLREMGIELTKLEDTQFVVRQMTIDFVKPGSLDNPLEIVSQILEVKGASIRYNQKAQCCGDTLCSADVLIVCLDKALRPKRLPTEFFKECIT